MKTKKVIMLKGLPASGKSTWANDQVWNSKGEWIRINKDDLRAMIHVSAHSKEREKQILDIRNYLIGYYMSCGKNIIVDDTNFAKYHEDKIKSLVDMHPGEFKYELEIKIFDTDLDECIKRDLRRGEKVGEKVIRKMHSVFLNKEEVMHEPIKNDKARAIIVDIDGTLAHSPQRNPYDYSQVINDVCDPRIKELVEMYRNNMGTEIIILSGREGNKACFDATINWLDQHDIIYHELHMRKEGDHREDSIVKEELYRKHVEPYFETILVIDDRSRVVKMWRKIGLKCIQVERGEF